MKPFFKYILFIFTASLLSCGFFSDQEREDARVYQNDKYSTGKIDAAAFGEILKRDISEEIDTISENLKKYAKSVKRANNRVITEKDLNRFVKKFVDSNNDKTDNAIKILFKVNSILFNTKKNTIMVNDIDSLFMLMKSFNMAAYQIDKILNTKDDDSVFQNREKIQNLTTKFQNIFLSTQKLNKINPVTINIRAFIKDIEKSFENKKFDRTLPLFFQVVKKLFTGGDRSTLNALELRHLTTVLPNLLKTAFGMIRIREKHFDNIEDHKQAMLLQVRSIKKLISPFKNRQVVLNIDEFFRLYRMVSDSDKIIGAKSSVIKTLLNTLKPELIGGNKTDYSHSNILEVIKLAENFFEMEFFNHYTYSFYDSSIKSLPEATKLQRLVPERYEVLSERRIIDLHRDFVHISDRYRFYRDEKRKVLYYTDEIHRTLYGFNEYARIRWVVSKLFPTYSGQDNRISKEELAKFLIDLRPLLEQEKLWSKYPKTFARNTILLADLFQYGSDGDLHMDTDESTEYFSLIINAITIKNDLNVKLKKTCQVETPVFPLDCFRENLFDIMFNELNYADYFTKLYLYKENATEDEFYNYLIRVEEFAKEDKDPENPDPNAPIDQRNLILILGAFLNIETTFIRFDKNRDNILDPLELDVAFKTYKNAIVELSVQAGYKEDSISGYEKSIFLFLIKYMDLPSKPEMLLFHYGRPIRKFIEKKAAKKLEEFHDVITNPLKVFFEKKLPTGVKKVMKDAISYMKGLISPKKLLKKIARSKYIPDNVKELAKKTKKFISYFNTDPIYSKRVNIGSILYNLIKNPKATKKNTEKAFVPPEDEYQSFTDFK